MAVIHVLTKYARRDLTAEMGFPIELVFVETDDEFGPFGAKGVGEPGLVPTAPAIANAVYNTVGIRIHDVPITPEKVLRALKQKRMGGRSVPKSTLGPKAVSSL